jgi:hypothetical protein
MVGRIRLGEIAQASRTFVFDCESKLRLNAGAMLRLLESKSCARMGSRSRGTTHLKLVEEGIDLRPQVLAFLDKHLKL